jgi:hypothetical protein
MKNRIRLTADDLKIFTSPPTVIAMSEAKKQSINKVELGFQDICCKKNHFCGLPRRA